MSLYLLGIMGIFVGFQLWRSLRILLTGTVHRFQSNDDVTKPYSERYRKDWERATSGRYIGRYEGASKGRLAIRFGCQLLFLACVGVGGWLLMLIDAMQDSSQLGNLSAIGLSVIFMSMLISSIVDYIDQRNFKLRRLR